MELKEIEEARCLAVFKGKLHGTVFDDDLQHNDGLPKAIKFPCNFICIVNLSLNHIKIQMSIFSRPPGFHKNEFV